MNQFMPRLLIGSLLGFVLALAFASTLSSAQDEKATLEPDNKWTNFAAESKAEFQFTVKTPRPFKGRVEWSFNDVATANRRPIPGGSGTRDVTADAKKPATIKISLVIPPVKEGVIWETQFTVSLFADGEKKPEAEYKKTFWLFPADPLVDRSKWFEGLKITLFDSDPKSKTAEALMKLPALKDLKKPFEQINNAAGLSELKEGLLLVGEGVSFKDEAGLAEELVKAASRGVPVLVLAPKDGNFPLPGADNMLPAPGSLALQRPDIITKLDKRLDAAAWAPKNQVVASSLAVKTDDAKVIAEFQDGAKGWPWLQLDYPDKKGRLIVCGFGIVRQWDDSPTPRFLLARLLEHVTELTLAKEAAKE